MEAVRMFAPVIAQDIVAIRGRKEVETDALGAMAQPPTAGFDPIFSIHHTNIDRIWAKWACMPGKTWGKLPDSAWFSERPWFFFDA